MNFCWRQVTYRVLHERNCALVLSQRTLKQLVWESLANKFCRCYEQFIETLHFCRIFADERLFTVCSMEGAAPCFIGRALLRQPWQSLTDEFCQNLEQFSQTLHVCRISADGRLCTGCSKKGAARLFFSQSALKQLLWECFTNSFY